jgi:hypothetical protein
MVMRKWFQIVQNMDNNFIIRTDWAANMLGRASPAGKGRAATRERHSLAHEAMDAQGSLVPCQAPGRLSGASTGCPVTTKPGIALSSRTPDSCHSSGQDHTRTHRKFLEATDRRLDRLGSDPIRTFELPLRVAVMPTT